MNFLLYILIGFGISMLSGFFGIGGGFVLTPLLLLFGFSPIDAITTSLLYTIGTSLAGIYAHFKLKNIYWKSSIIIGISGAIATQFAYPFVRWLERIQMDSIVIPSFYLALLLYFAYSMLMKKRDHKHNAVTPISPKIWTLILLGFFAGFLSTTLGVGGGFFLVPLLISFFGFQSKNAVATSLAGVLFIVSTGFTTYAINIEIHWTVGLFLISGAIFGSPLGAKATSYFDTLRIQQLLGFLYITTLISLVLKLLHFNTIGFIILSIFTLAINVILLSKLLRQRKVAVG